MTQTKWDIRFLRIAKQQVAEWSKDPDKKVGCVIVSLDRRQLTMGFNGFPQGVEDTSDRLASKSIKNELMVHAELNAILNARIDLTGWTIYVTEPPCIECAKAIIQAGIARVVCPPIHPDSHWSVDQIKAKHILIEAGSFHIQETEKGYSIVESEKFE